jgi:hypothetical protein
MADTPLRERFAAATEGNEWGVFLVALGVLFLAVGYGGGSVLAGEGFGDQLWAVPVAGLSVVVMALLAYQILEDR